MTARPILIAFLLVLTSFTVTAKDKKDKDTVPVTLVKDASGAYSFEQVIEVADVKKEELYSRAKAWVIANVKSEDNNNAFDDKEYTITNTGAVKIDGKHTMMWVIKDGYFDFKLQLQFKDGRYKIHIDNMTAHVVDGMRGLRSLSYGEMTGDKPTLYCRDQVNIKLDAFITALEDAIKAKPAKSDW